MDWNGDVECERPVVHHVDGKEQRSADTPFSEWNGRWLDEILTIRIELIMQSRETSEYELEERDEKPATWLVP